MFIWYNPGIKIINASIFWKRFFDVGILYICDLFEPVGSTLAFEQWLHKGLTYWLLARQDVWAITSSLRHVICGKFNPFITIFV